MPDRKKLARLGRKIARERLALGKGGNISARNGSYAYLKAKGAALGTSKAKDYVRIDIKTGRCKSGVPSTEKYMHTACYEERPDVNAVLHLHPVFSTAVANSKIKLGPVSYELAATLGSEIARARYRPAHSKALAGEIARLVKKFNAILMPNHGLLVVGRDLDTAFERVLAVERACKTLIFSHLLGLGKFLPKKEALRIIALCGKGRG